ncbi:NADPH-dependent assimilatory sulfite reductase hemoprotein subunit [Alkalicoccus luteus]|uniref:Sulfite reductase [NADPH] hemoprotein beta-component n=1 Tax=Alkalicoccus luteus TaxID=1237094 RepID=A0A969PYY2_9BACI|nr:NADPH-dependent assimilatory sulfite reductase hemoprotein subunit [Alkalicoccus luteus]NJP38117.1 NADPH-dependent assimilatory sulfite reductase hemoprotein subunit [Alkalicoccus luteus]
MSTSGKPSETEHIKQDSSYLRGRLEEFFQDHISAGIPDDQTKLLKFHGSYMQDDRDLREERRKQKLEPAYQFMVRVRLPAGVATPEQWLTMDRLADEYGNGTMKLTTRQTFQLHGILKWNMKTSLQQMNEALMDTIAACGDVNRNVMCAANPSQSDAHRKVYDSAADISERLLPKTRAYHEIWLDEEKLIDTKEEQEPVYGKTYLPRKFKIGVAVPPSNDVDIYSQDIGFIAIISGGRLLGYNILVGGGMGMTHGDEKTYPQLGRMLGFVPAKKAVEAAEAILTVQRDYGDRSERKYARFKYTVDRLGIETVRNEVNERLGWEVKPAKPYSFERNGDIYGWDDHKEGLSHLTLFIQNGRIADSGGYELKTALKRVAEVHDGTFRLTPNQNVIIADVKPENREQIEAIVSEYGLTDGCENSALRRNSMACVAFPTCGLAMAESERYLPSLIDKLEDMLDANGLREEEIIIRMTGCPNGCARPSLGEIAFIGKGPGTYNMYLGAGFKGDRLNKLYRENIGEEQILQELQPIFASFAKDKEDGERFGDFVIRRGIIEATTDGINFHEKVRS